MTETIPSQVMLKCSQPSLIMPLHHIRKAIHVLSPVLFIYHPYITCIQFVESLDLFVNNLVVGLPAAGVGV